MSEKKVLLELRGVKTFFPVRGGFFNKVRDHVQAVNDVDLANPSSNWSRLLMER